MNTAEYIDSGVLELFALGALSDAENAEVERNIILYSELSAELSRIQTGLSAYLVQFAREVPVSLRSRVLDSAKPAPEKAEVRPGVAVAPSPVKSLQHSQTYKYLMTASLAALVISTFASWFFYTRWTEAEERYTSLLAEKNDMAINYNVMRSAFDKVYTDMLIIRDSDFKLFTLQPDDTGSANFVRVLWSPSSHHVYADLIRLDSLIMQQTLQLWAGNKGSYLSAGTLSFPDTEGLIRMDDVLTADEWLLCLPYSEDSVIARSRYTSTGQDL